MATLVFLVSILLIILLNTPLTSPGDWLSGAFPATAGLMILAILAIGYSLNGRPEGLIIDNRNRMSLSKLQMLMWTIVVVSALTVYAAYNIRLGHDKPLKIDIPNELLFAMGIAAASFVATPTILSLKSQETPSTGDVADALADPTETSLDNRGKVHGRAFPSEAKWSDIFRGDEVGNYDTPDLGKIQQFAITLLLVGVYSSQVIAVLSGLTGKSGPLATLPALDHQFVVLMGISHASYLAYKASPHTASGDASGQTGSTPPPTPAMS